MAAAAAAVVASVPFPASVITAHAASPASASAAAAPVNPLPPQLAVPASGVYLGSFYDPRDPALSTTNPYGDYNGLANEIYALNPPANANPVPPATPFGSGPNRSLVIVKASEPWYTSGLVSGAPAGGKHPDLYAPNDVYNTQLQQIYAGGGVPLIEWSCGVPDNQVATGGSDDNIKAFADQLKDSAVPVLIDWFADPESSTAPLNCLKRPGTKTSDTTNWTGDYVSAYQRIINVFAGEKATNVSFVWSTDPSDNWAKQQANGYPASHQFYPFGGTQPPGVSEWVGAESARPAAPDSATLGALTAWYTAAQAEPNPLMISGLALNKATTGGGTQSSFLSTLTTDLTTTYQKLKALVVDDGTAGVDPTALGALAASAVVKVPRAPVDVVVGGPQVAVNQVAKLTATNSAAASGGTYEFLDGSAPIEGCTAVPAILGGLCSTSALAIGEHTITVEYSGDATHSPGTSAPFDYRISNVEVSGSSPGIPAVNSAYLGAWQLNPAQAIPTGVTRAQWEIDQLNGTTGDGTAGFNSGLGRNLSIVHVFQSWDQPAGNGILGQIVATGAIPMIDWRCGDHDDQVMAGNDDALIDKYAAQLKALNAPVFLRWYWEPNLNPSTGCQSAGAGGATGPEGYIGAWRHIHDLFVAAGATNVSFVWAVSSVSADKDDVRYFPGAKYVDWIGVDGYYRSLVAPPQTAVSDIFSGWYGNFATSGLPLVITETGAETVKVTPTDPHPKNPSQGAYVQLLGSYVQANPRIRGVAYFDGNAANFDYTLSGDGLAAFQSLSSPGGSVGQTFLPPRQATALSPSATPNAVTGQEVSIDPGLSFTDLGGRISYTISGDPSALPGCAAVPVDGVDTCSSDALPTGTYTVTVSYSGDAEYGSATASVTLVIAQGSGGGGGPHTPRVPNGSWAYLGAWVQPGTSGTTPGAGMAAEALAAAELFHEGCGQTIPGLTGKSCGTPLSIIDVFEPWDNPVAGQPTDVETALRHVARFGAIPLITWRCSASANDDAIVSGAEDTVIRAFATEIAAVGSPMFLRLSDEPNNPSSETQGCLGDLGPQGFQEAYQHIHDLFRASGADNVAFVWSLSASGDMNNLPAYYPGSSYVDWVAVDGYPLADKFQNETGSVLTNDVFHNWYQQVQDAGWGDKPLMISETGQREGSQAAYINQLAADMQGGQFNGVKAVVFIDGSDPRAPGTDLTIDQAGRDAITSLGQTPFFTTPRTQVKVTVTYAVRSGPKGGHTLQLNAQLDTSGAVYDGGGALTFMKDGQPIAACSDVSPSAASCIQAGVTPGSYVYSASFQGDTAFSSADSNTLPVTIQASGGGGTPGVPWVTPTPGTTSPTSTPGGATPAGSSIPFSGRPTIGQISPEAFPVSGGSSVTQTVPTVPPYSRAVPKPLGGALGVLPVALARHLTEVPGANWILLAAFALAVAAAAYMVTTSIQDRRRRAAAAAATSRTPPTDR